MFKKLLAGLFLSFTFLNASYETLRIGHIDSFYGKMITKEQLRKIIKEIEDTFESTLGFNVFDLEEGGKPIDLIHLPSTKAELTIDELTKKIEKKKSKIQKLQSYFLSKQDYIKQTQGMLKKEAGELNKKVTELNDYINKANQKRIVDKYEYNRIKTYIDKEKKAISLLQNSLGQKKIKYNDFLSAYKQKLSLYNSEINEFYRLQRKLEVLVRASSVVKGAAIGYKKVGFKTFNENGQTVQKLVEQNYMEKIEIYGFKSLPELKAILAHEIAHMVGVDHVNARGALMNPVLQKNQIGNLKLTDGDIKAFMESF